MRLSWRIIYRFKRQRSRKIFVKGNGAFFTIIVEKAFFLYMKKANTILMMNTVAFTVCFACWMIHGVLVTFLVKNGVFNWDQTQMGTLIGVPIVTGSLARLPIGILTDKFGGRVAYFWLMIFSAVALLGMSFVNSFIGFLLGGLCFGLAGASFAVGVAYTSVWFEQKKQGTVLGLFGMGNIGAAITSMGAPYLLIYLTGHGLSLEGWRFLPAIYAVALLVTALLFLLLTPPLERTEPEDRMTRDTSLIERLVPLKDIRVWRFGFYYFLTFGGFVALAQWLIPYYVHVYQLDVTQAGMIAAVFSLSSALIRAVGGFISDKIGARRIMYWVLSGSFICCVFLSIPQLGLSLFTPIVFLLSIFMGVGMAAVYKHIPSYFPGQVGLVGGLVGLIGGLGGFFLPIFFGYLTKITGLWSSCWVLFLGLIAVCLFWMHHVVRHLIQQKRVSIHA